MHYSKIFLALFTLSLLLVIRFYSFYSSPENLDQGSVVSLSGRVVGRVQENASQQRFSFLTKKGNIVFVTTKRIPRIFTNQRLVVTGRIDTRLLENGKIASSMYFPNIEAKSSSLGRLFNTIQNNLIIIFSSYLPPASSSLLLGIVFGIRDTMSEDLVKQLAESGIIHITAASGMNVVLVAGVLVSLTNRFLIRQKAIVLSILALWFYSAIAGFDPSIVRAAIMTTLALGATLIGRQYTSLLALFIAGYIMVFVDPVLVSNIGFQLSFTSTLGLIGLSYLVSVDSAFNEDFKPEEETGESKPVLYLFVQDLLVTFAAQIATLPILLIYFGTYNPFSIFANMLILWSIPILMALGSIGALLGLIYHPLGIFLALNLPFTEYILIVSKIFANAPKINVVNFSWHFLVLYYTIVLLIIIYIKRHKVKNK